MRPDKALAIVQRIGAKRCRRMVGRVSAPMPIPVYAAPPKRRWTWDGASAREKGNWVRSNRALGIMDWDLCDLFNLTPKGLAAIVRGADWKPDFDNQQFGKTEKP